MLELNPYAPPGFGAQLDHARPSRVAGGDGDLADPEGIRRAHVHAERTVLVIAGVGYALGLCILAWGALLLADEGWHGVPGFVILGAIGSASVIGARWLSLRLPRGRWCASGLSALCGLMLSPLALFALSQHGPRPLALSFLVPIGVLAGLWWPGVGAVFDERYRRRVIPQTPHLEPRVALPLGVAIGVTIAGAVVVLVTRL